MSLWATFGGSFAPNVVRSYKLYIVYSDWAYALPALCCHLQMVTALALAGDLRFNPLEDTLTDANGTCDNASFIYYLLSHDPWSFFYALKSQQYVQFTVNFGTSHFS